MDYFRVESSLLGFLVGVAGCFVSWWFFVILVIGFAFVIVLKTSRKFFIAVFLFLVFAIGGFFFARSYNSRHASQLPESFFDTKEIIIGRVVFDPEFSLTHTQVIIHPIIISDKNVLVPDRIIIAFPPDQNIGFGDTMGVITTLQHPQNFLTDTDREFDYIHYLQLHGVYATASAKTFSVVHNDSANPIAKIFSFKHAFVKSLQEIFKGDQTGMLDGILIGQKSLLSRATLNELSSSGLTHLIVLSGYNITVIALFMMQIFAWLGAGYRSRRVLSVCFVALFIAATGFSAAAVRPAIMIIILFILQISARPADIFRVLLFALVIMVAIKPPALVYDVSLQLSFIGFLGLAYGTPMIEHLFQKFHFIAWDDFRALLAETIAVQLSVLPYIIWMNGTISAFIAFANFITVPVVPWVMAAGFFDVLIGMVSKPIATFFSFPIHFALRYLLSVAHIVASWNSLIWQVPPISGWWIVGIYGCLGIGFSIWNISKERKRN